MRRTVGAIAALDPTWHRASNIDPRQLIAAAPLIRGFVGVLPNRAVAPGVGSRIPVMKPDQRSVMETDTNIHRFLYCDAASGVRDKSAAEKSRAVPSHARTPEFLPSRGGESLLTRRGV